MTDASLINMPLVACNWPDQSHTMVDGGSIPRIGCCVPLSALCFHRKIINDSRPPFRRFAILNVHYFEGPLTLSLTLPLVILTLTLTFGIADFRNSRPLECGGR